MACWLCKRRCALRDSHDQTRLFFERKDEVNRTQLLITAIALLILSACAAPQAPVPVADNAMDDHAGVMTEGEMTESDGAMAEGEMKEGDGSMGEGEMKEGDGSMAEGEMKEGDAMMSIAELPAWAALPLVNARTGEPFTIADFAGRTIFVEPMATWCTNCRAQLTNVKAAKAQLAGDDVIFVALSVETTLDQTALAQYAEEHGFDWVFAVATPELLQQLAGDLGQTVTNPPATPHFVISPDGTVGELATGIESVEAIVARVQG